VEAQAALDGFIDELARLPRMTREFFGWMVDESEHPRGFDTGSREVNADYVDAKCRAMPNYLAEIRLLTARGFIDYDRDESHLSGKFHILFPGTGRSNFGEAFTYFREATGLKAATVFSTMNFSPFGPPPPPVKAAELGTDKVASEVAKVKLPRRPSKAVASPRTRGA